APFNAMVAMAAAMDKSKKRSMIFCSFAWVIMMRPCAKRVPGSSTRHEEYGQKVSFAHIRELVAGLNASMSTTHRHKSMGVNYSPSSSRVYSNTAGAH